MGTVVDDIRQLLKDCELFVFEILQDENLSEPAQEAREILLRNFHIIQKRYPQEFPHRFESNLEDSSDDNRSSSLGRSAPSDDMSVASDYQEEGASELFEEIPLVAAQDLSNILKQGYLEKKRRDHSFFSMEWQKRWCVLNNTIFYYFGSEKDKQQKGSFYINGYSAELVPSLRKDSKKNSCFEMSAPGRRSYQVQHTQTHSHCSFLYFSLKLNYADLSSNFIPFDDDEEEEVEEEEETYDDIERATTPPPPRPGPASAPVTTLSLGQTPQSSHKEWKDQAETQEDEEEDEEDIYEVLPDDENTDNAEEWSEKPGSSDYANYYQGLWDCEADRPDELAFQRGDVIHILSKIQNT
ncbi:src kinase-associated phosphoprotein 1-like [Sinocyclocheilus rhinocerous]|uniref:src kinase-associated phosphoprotein 1-like n=1 Tax=Sinocyclocheilus rhinocerous TaxID=307959 RepID=UPI0007BACFA9|nr:PREDICTED: src kinase-associated phosphoprotein 1-like [Sinocyclocheilus rhinocerous]